MPGGLFATRGQRVTGVREACFRTPFGPLGSAACDSRPLAERVGHPRFWMARAGDDPRGDALRRHVAAAVTPPALYRRAPGQRSIADRLVPRHNWRGTTRTHSIERRVVREQD